MGNEDAGFGLLDGYIVASQFLGREGPPPEFHFDSQTEKRSRENWARFNGAFDGLNEAITKGDLARIMSFVSPDFRSASWPDRNALQTQFAEWLDAGGLTISGEPAFGMRGFDPGSTADISGLVLKASGQSVALTLIWTMQPDMSWLLTDIVKENE